MILFYIHQTFVGFAYASIYSLFNKKDHGIILFFIPYLQYMPKYEKIECFYSMKYQYYDYFNIQGDSTLNACVSWGISWILFNALFFWILGLCPIFYFVFGLTILIFILTLIILIKSVYFAKYAMQIIFFCIIHI